MKNVLVLLLFPTILFSQASYKAVGVGAFDGDSPTIKVGDSTFHVRLYGVDAPERPSIYVTKRQPGSQESGDHLRLLMKKDTVTVFPIYKDQFDRWVCKIVLSDSSDVSEYQLKRGHAWFREEPKMSKEDRTFYRHLHNTAKDLKVGLWGLSGRKYTPAWWRRTYSGWKER